jgi:hypothetical protein
VCLGLLLWASWAAASQFRGVSRRLFLLDSHKAFPRWKKGLDGTVRATQLTPNQGISSRHLEACATVSIEDLFSWGVRGVYNSLS